MEKVGLEATMAKGLFNRNIVAVDDEFNAVYVNKPAHQGGAISSSILYFVNYVIYWDEVSSYFIFVKSRSHHPTTEIDVIRKLLGVEVIPHPSQSMAYTFTDESERLIFTLKGFNFETNSPQPNS